MKEFTYTIKDPLGIHARPAGQIAKVAKGFADTAISLSANGKTVKLSQLMKLMGLGVKQGTEVTVSCEGPAEEEAANTIKAFFEENL